ncbi:MAG: pyridoxal phosphate-dependent aminotransferase [Bdellovibrionales bacterium]|nr:pyridoxal phosphate-dependent aminotransferase [Bdellovibrionales bacterium]
MSSEFDCLPQLPEPFEAPLLQSLRQWCRDVQKDGGTLFDLSMINPDLAPPREMLDRFIEASLKPSTHRYSSARGIRKLREAFAEKYRSQFGVSLDAHTEVCVTLGSKDATLQVLEVLAPMLKRVWLPAPTYPVLRSAVSLVGYEEVGYYQADREESLVENLSKILKESPRALVLLNSPNNPTGKSLSRESLQHLIRLAGENGSILFNDFVYGEMGYFKQPCSLLAAAAGNFRNVLEVYSLSKAYSIPGWRVAGLVGSGKIVEAVAQRKANTDYGTFTPLQVGAAQGLRSSHSFLPEQRERYAERAKVVVELLKGAGCRVELPEAGASVWAKLPDWYSSNAEVFAKEVLLKSGVVLLPGNVFGESYCRYFRIALVQPKRVLSECLTRVVQELSRASGVALSEETSQMEQ